MLIEGATDIVINEDDVIVIWSLLVVVVGLMTNEVLPDPGCSVVVYVVNIIPSVEKEWSIMLVDDVILRVDGSNVVLLLAASAKTEVI